ncbi:uncharacterized protein LOC109839390 [Asparagus officinalis]|uniref:uncharacterized protein LOC109839390 n=1 Tax=Asparagus officinalis TaxID=4686 RepID=UPI00098E2756|nr:uncharacterized protein LOC109839390 [Asparagus officinalis]
MKEDFEMTDLGLMRYFLGLQVKQTKGEIFINQEKYCEDLLKRFNMKNCNPVATPALLNEKLSTNDGAPKVDASSYRSLVGSLIYLTNTKPDILYVVSIVSRFMSNPSKLHYGAAKQILRYLQGTKSMGIKYTTEEDNALSGYTDSDWAGCITKAFQDMSSL